MSRTFMFLTWLGCTNTLTLAAEPIDRMSLAANALDRGDTTTAIAHLSAHVRQSPDDAMTRALLAELLFKNEKWLASQTEFHQFVEVAQTLSGPVHAHLVHAHTRLMTIAERRGDPYCEELNRGIGLYRLVLKWNSESGRKDASTAEETLLKAAKALRAAQDRVPNCPRTSWYLYQVYHELGQMASARVALRRAQESPPSGLTAHEAEQLARCLANAHFLPRIQEPPAVFHRGER